MCLYVAVYELARAKTGCWFKGLGDEENLICIAF